MANSIVKSLIRKTGRPLEEIESLWDRAFEIAVKTVGNDSNNTFAYTVGILKKMLKMAKKEGLLTDPKELIEDYLKPGTVELDESSWRMRAEPKADASIIYKGDSFKARQKAKDAERKRKRLKASKDKGYKEGERITTGNTDGHTHTYQVGDKLTSENDSHSHQIRYKDGKPSEILPGPKNGHTHSVRKAEVSYEQEVDSLLGLLDEDM